MEILRTPDERFVSLPGYAFAPHYADVGDSLRMHYLDEGSPAALPILLMHGEPSWSFLYRKMIPLLVAAGHRIVAPDLIGFGRSDKPAARTDYTYQRHIDWTTALIDKLDLQHITLFCQDWGGLLGLRIAAENESRFARIVASNTGLPTGDQEMPEAFFKWQRLSQEIPELPVGGIVARGCVSELPADVIAAYDAPFPEERFKAGARQFPMLVPSKPDDPASEANRRAWMNLLTWKKPFLTAFGDSDPITRGADRMMQSAIPGANGQPHVTLKGGGHFIQEDCGEQLARIVTDFIVRT